MQLASGQLSLHPFLTLCFDLPSPLLAAGFPKGRAFLKASLNIKSGPRCYLEAAFRNELSQKDQVRQRKGDLVRTQPGQGRP